MNELATNTTTLATRPTAITNGVSNRFTGQLALSEADFKEVMKKPLRVLPSGPLRQAVLRLWAMNQGACKTPLAIAASLRTWIEKNGLTMEDAEVIVDDMCSPGAMAGFRFESEIVTCLAAKVAQKLEQRRSEAETLRRRKEAEDAEKNKVPPERVKALIELLRTPDGEITSEIPPPQDNTASEDFARTIRNRERS